MRTKTKYQTSRGQNSYSSLFSFSVLKLSIMMVKVGDTIGTFRSEYEYEFSVLSTRISFRGRHFSKCACSERKTRTRSRTRTPI